MAPPFNIDDPAHLSRFLAVLHGATETDSSQTQATGGQSQTASHSIQQAVAHTVSRVPDAHESDESPQSTRSPVSGSSSRSPPNTTESRSRDSADSPGGVIKAPPPTPASQALTPQLNGTPEEALPAVTVTQEVPDFTTLEPSLSEDPSSSPSLTCVEADSAPESPQVATNTTPLRTSPQVEPANPAVQLLIDLANRSTEDLSHSKHAPQPARRALRINPNWSSPSQLAVAPTPTVPIITHTPPIDSSISTATMPYRLGTKPKDSPELVKKMKPMSTSSNLQDSVVAKFRKQHLSEDNDLTKAKASGTVKDQAGDGKWKAVEMIKEEGAVSDVGKSTEVTDDVARSKKPALWPPLMPGTANSGTVKEGEDRENAAYFTTWGHGAPRDVPRSRIRTVLLTHLPPTADATFVTSLIHGGAIETLKLTTADDSLTAIARVTFTEANAAEAYYAKYPDGLDIKDQGKRYTAFVDMGKDVDVISGVMRGYLESGASRIVRVSGADEDWGMRALKKQAEEKGRKAEAIVDTTHGEVRIIIFRFTNISDAVHFKGQLVRDMEWEGSDVHFGEDPCAKATGVHFEK